MAEHDVPVRDAGGQFETRPLEVGDIPDLSAVYDAAGAAAGVTAASIGAVPTSRAVTAGTGLTGGGDLSANRTLAPDFGSGAGKVTQGNDSRLSDARTPTTHAASHKAGGDDDLSGVQNGFAPLSSGLLVPIAYLGTGTPDGTKFLRDDGVFATPSSSGAPTTAKYVTTASDGGLSAELVIPGLAGSQDRLPSSPHASDLEFDALTGTVLGSLSIDNVTDFPSHWHAGMAAAAPFLNGRYWTIPSLPCTITAKFTALKIHGGSALYPTIGIMLLDSTPTAIREFYYGTASTAYSVGLRRWTSRTAFSSSVDETPLAAFHHPEVWIKLLVTSASSVTMSYSYDGYLYLPVAGVTAISPTITPAFFGLDVSVPTSTGTTSEFVCEWARIT